MPPVKLRLVDLTKRYGAGTTPAVDGLTMDVEEGQMVALLGPSGCGKTTTLRMVAGLLDPTAGSILVDGKDITASPVHKRGMGMVFQSYALFPHMNVEQNVAFGLQMRRMTTSDQVRRVNDALDLVQLGHLSKRRVKELSGGQQQRVALARALVIEPTLLLLDEPLSNLDAKLRESMRVEIRAIQRRTHATTLFVTHDQDEALAMADKIAIMNGGLIEQFGSPSDVYERPLTRFVANFIGRANILRARVLDQTSSSGDSASYDVEVSGIGTFGAVGSPGMADTERNIVIRPHRLHVRAADSTSSGDSLRVTGVVEEVSYTGDALSCRVRVGELLMASESHTAGGEHPGIGDEYTIEWSSSDALILPEELNQSETGLVAA